MTSRFIPDAEVTAAMTAAAGGGTEVPVTWKSLRAGLGDFYAAVTRSLPRRRQVSWTTFSTEVAGGETITLHWFTSADASPAAVVQAHGGGRVAGQVEMFAPYLEEYVARAGVSVLAVEYRLAPEASGVTPTEDVFAGLSWLHENARRLSIDQARIGLLGESAGGGLVAGAALLAHERGLDIARQLLVYPMLDDRTGVVDEHRAPFSDWIIAANHAGWNALLGDDRGTDRVSPVAAPARAADFSVFPKTYLEVGELDLFRDEVVTFAQNLWAAGISTELYVVPGGVHGYDHWSPGAAITLRAMEHRIAFLRSL